MTYAARTRRQPAIQTGEATLRYPGFSGTVDYQLVGTLKGLRVGGPSLRGSVKTTPDQAREMFGAGRGHLQLEDGKEYRVTIVGHTEGSDIAYFELMV